MAEIEIVNKASVTSAANNLIGCATEMSSCCVELDEILARVKIGWMSTGVDKQSFFTDLSKQSANLKILETELRNFGVNTSVYINSVNVINSNTVGNPSGNSSGAGGSSSATPTYSNTSVGSTGFSPTVGYMTAKDAVNNTNPVNLYTDYVNDSSSIQSFAVVNQDGSLGQISSADNITLEGFASQNGVDPSNIAVNLGDAAWVSADELNIQASPAGSVPSGAVPSSGSTPGGNNISGDRYAFKDSQLRDRM